MGMTLTSGLRCLGCSRGLVAAPRTGVALYCAVAGWPAPQGSRLLTQVPTPRCTRWLRLLAEWIRKQTQALVGL